MLRFMGRVGLDVYIYAPKNDPYHRSRWREAYPADARDRLRELVSVAAQSDVEFWYAISPGLTMTYSDSADYRDLVEKIDRVAELGVQHFGLFLDDVPAELTSAADRDAFGTLVQAHVALTNRLHADLAARGFTLTLTPTTYTDAWGDRDYLAAIGAGVVPDVKIIWTGPDVASPTISAEQATAWGSLLQRPPLLWDNYPVNDYARWRLFLGPFAGRAVDLASATAGIIANPMNEVHGSMIALATLADYADDPSGYNPQLSLDEALAALYGRDADLLNPFLDAFGDYGWDGNLFEPLYILTDSIPVVSIESTLARLQDALDAIESRAAANADLQTLHEEIAPFVAQYRDRVAELRRSPDYEDRGGMLFYRTDLDQVTASRVGASVTVDGRTSEWRSADWRPLYRGSDRPTATRAAFRYDDELLYVAVETPNPNIRIREGITLGEGDHIAVVVDGDPLDGPIGGDDLFLLFPPPNGAGEPVITALPFQGHMAKWLADNRALTFTEFHLSTFATDPSPVVASIAAGVRYATGRTRTGYTAEIALPHQGRDVLRLSLTVTSTGGGKRVASLSRRNYPANPVTFAEIRLQE
jgi:hypothetical protein